MTTFVDTSQSLLHQGIGRTSLGRCTATNWRVSVPSSSGHRPDYARINKFGCTCRLSPFFIRASAGPIIPREWVDQDWSQSLLHQGIGRTPWPVTVTRAAMSQSLLHQGIGRTKVRVEKLLPPASQSLLHQGIGRTGWVGFCDEHAKSQSLLHQGIGRTKAAPLGGV